MWGVWRVGEVWGVGEVGEVRSVCGWGNPRKYQGVLKWDFVRYQIQFKIQNDLKSLTTEEISTFSRFC